MWGRFWDWLADLLQFHDEEWPSREYRRGAIEAAKRIHEVGLARAEEEYDLYAFAEDSYDAGYNSILVEQRISTKPKIEPRFQTGDYSETFDGIIVKVEDGVMHVITSGVCIIPKETAKKAEEHGWTIHPRSASTSAEDGLTIVSRQAVLHYPVGLPDAHGVPSNKMG